MIQSFTFGRDENRGNGFGGRRPPRLTEASRPKESSRWRDFHLFPGLKGRTGLLAGTGGGQQQVKASGSLPVRVS